MRSRHAPYTHAPRTHAPSHVTRHAHTSTTPRQNGSTALLTAAAAGQEAALRLLLAAGADTEKYNNVRAYVRTWALCKVSDNTVHPRKTITVVCTACGAPCCTDVPM